MPRNRSCLCIPQIVELNPCVAFLASVQVPLSFDVPLTNTMGFVPVQFRQPNSAALKPHVGNPFQLPPPARTIDLLARSRIELRDAMISTSRISSMISKSIFRDCIEGGSCRGPLTA